MGRHMWAGGISNPLTVIEQLTYLMFIKSLDDRETENEAEELVLGVKLPRILKGFYGTSLERKRIMKKRSVIQLLENLLEKLQDLRRRQQMWHSVSF